MAKKKTGINLQKGNHIVLEKEGQKLEEVCIGINWGAIHKNVMFNLFRDTITVDLDASVAVFDYNDNCMETIYYYKVVSRDGAIKHSGDDRSGDIEMDDLDNEVITINLPRVDHHVKQLVIFITSYQGKDFAKIPYSNVRIYEGTPNFVESIFANFNLSSEKKFKGKTAIALGKLERIGTEWEFISIGEALDAHSIDETVLEIKKRFLK